MSDNSGILFEDEIRELLDKLGFCDVPGYGSEREDFTLGGQEIDAFGRINDVYLVIDARTSTESNGTGQVQSRLEAINGYKQIVTQDIQSIFGSNHGFRHCVFVFWTKNKKITAAHRGMARRLEIALRDDFDLKHYFSGLHLLENPEIVRNSFLKDLSNQLGCDVFVEGSGIHVDAIRTKSGNRKFYTFLIEARHLLKFAYVFRVETNNILSSYQRLISGRKIRRIQRYLRRQGYFANNILVASDEDLHLEEEDDARSIMVGRLTLPDKPCYLEIIDGQHRLFGYSNLPTLQNNCLNVTVISNLSEVERAKLFVVVNREQTKVPQYLLWDLYSTIEPDSLRGKISKFVQNLNRHGPLRNLVKLPRERSNKAFLSFANICMSFYSRTGLYKNYSSNPSFTAALNSYFSVIRDDQVVGEDWGRSVENKGKAGFLCTNNAISIQIYLLAKILKRLDQEGMPFPTSDEMMNWKEYLEERISEPLRQYLQANFDQENSEDPYGTLRKETSNEAKRGEAATTIFNEINFN
jgi:DGQHR domain-containing protein